jgi:hypothetical protein
MEVKEISVSVPVSLQKCIYAYSYKFMYTFHIRLPAKKDKFCEIPLAERKLKMPNSRLEENPV